MLRSIQTQGGSSGIWLASLSLYTWGKEGGKECTEDKATEQENKRKAKQKFMGEIWVL